MSRWAVVLAGGIGSRFWPLSTPDRPKQLLPLIDRKPLLANTLDRLRPLVPADRTLILTNASLRLAVSEVAADVPRNNVIAEPRPAGTAAALTWAAVEIERRAGSDAVMMCVHADWAIADDEAFRSTLSAAADAAARHRSLVTVGIVPARPDPGFGYVQPGATVEGELRRVARFVEKPDQISAGRMVGEGYLWNSGIFVWRVGDFLDEVRALTPEVAPALDGAGGDLEAFFARARSVSVDVGVLERSKRVLVLPGRFGWDDVGTWGALRRVRKLDEAGNAVSGDVHTLEAQGNVVHAEGSTVVLYGVSDLVVVAKGGLTLVTTVDRAADLKTLVEALPAAVRESGGR
ncbi:MAG TPA: sugar phosphate nucleotidyltransferase [Gemmatimonadaceae bacterium]|nr:sugar phosphate nucleotidyltransferase [Gemmatimonadaceae bacterium]